MNELKPILYKLLLEPDVEAFRFSGTVEIILEADSPQPRVTLNALELAVWGCAVRANGELVACPFSVHPGKEELVVELPREMAGEIALKIDYLGKINESLGGFYRSRYTAAGRAGALAVTQFEESDARRALPCFDHPAAKAVFEIEMIIPEHLTAISNGPVVEEQPVDGGRKRVRFLPTPRMSTYLLFFGVGAFEFLTDDRDAVTVRVATTPGMLPYGRFGLDFGRKALRYCEDYYGIRYPLPKLDLIAVADFAFGAMENWGAITFRENLLLHVPGMTSRAGEERICEVIAHEIAHQWFGNLVTPSDWKYLWLNESFATYFGSGAVDHYYPDWGVWEKFIHANTARSLFRDALRETVSIEIPGGEHVVINEVTAPIIYSKGGSILRQVEGFLGREDFRSGLQAYLDRHAYGCAASHHLWEALEAVSQQPVTRLMKSWVEQPGHPLVEVDREGDRLRLRQKRFTFLPGDFDQSWVLPVAVRIFRENGEMDQTTVLFEGEARELPLGPKARAYKLNDGQTGFYRVLYYDRQNLEQLGRLVRTKGLSPEDRWGLEGDRHALFLAGRVTLEEYLQFLACYQNEDAFLPLMGIADSLFMSYLALNGAVRKKIAETGRGIFEQVLDRIGYDPVETERQTVSALRDEILFQACLYGSAKAAGFARQRFAALRQGGVVHPDIRRSVMQAGAAYDGEEAFAWLTAQLSATDSEHERINILHGLGSFADPGLIRRSLDFVLEHVPARNKFIPLCRFGVNPFAIPLLWDWFVSRFVVLAGLHPIHFERVIGGIIPFAGAGREPEVQDFFRAYLERKESARDTIRMALERLEINRRLRSTVPAASRPGST